MTYQEAESFLFEELQNFQNKGKAAYKGSLYNAWALAGILGNPHEKFKSIHVAGTNGKGSVSHMIAAGLQGNGYKVGLYTSPHYKTYRERIKINGQFIEESEVANFISKHKDEILNLRPSFFEITCAMAFDYFAKKEVDVAVIEVGLGGRLDSTNIITPLLSVITNISYDHQKILGDTLEKIAVEKAGIIKKDIPVLIGEKQVETTNIFNEIARQRNAPLYFAEDMDARGSREGFISQNYSNYQVKNLRTAFGALKVLKSNLKIDDAKVNEGIANISKLTYYIGRWSKIRENPTVVFDSAHNLAGVQLLMDQINSLDHETLRIVWGTTKEKDVEEILSILPQNATYYFCKADNSRALDADQLMTLGNNKGLQGYSYNSVKAAYNVALSESSERDLILVAGSTFVVAEVI